ncbi:hypothetical protein BHF71_03235 [Vulcanibacillus modesticaldus]|uniref:DUF4321 domain-containing protein n=1 Tax=Vulcanibacillus modesticaldus TaxID=337097 RepID=A0A1D2YSS4_9BACI|nr:DUF4321 domain-containing protein [Vulcanibacillus modesticaldus]OEF98048.1 hypothetical protein BHF71_03235 [Vulcanibacillus modesticaldus]
MRNKQTAILVIFLVVGLLLGSLIGEFFANWLPILNKSQQIVWEPRADFNILKYDFYLQVKLNVASVIGLLIAIWLYRKI